MISEIAHPLFISCVVIGTTVTTIIYRNRIRISPEFAFTLIAVQLSFPRRLWESCFIFGRSQSSLSIVWTDTIAYLARRYTKKFLRWHPILRYKRIKRYARALERFGGGGYIWGFLDGTFVGVARPAKGQKLAYSGYKKKAWNQVSGLGYTGWVDCFFGWPLYRGT